MENRYKIPNSVQQKYFLKLEHTSGQTSEQLAKTFGVVGKTYRDWRRGKFTIPHHVITKIKLLYGITLPFSQHRAEIAWKQSKINASQRGGIARYKKHGKFSTPEGCAKGGHKALEILRARGVVPIAKPFYPPNNYSIKLAEFVGILLGDGHINKRQWSITINSEADKEYLPYIKRLSEELFHYIPGVFHKPGSKAYVIYGGGKKFIQYFETLGLMPGNKIQMQVNAPVWIQNNITYRIACLRGLMDTDGRILTHKYTVNHKEYSYTKLCFVNRSIPLIMFVYDTLRMIKLHPNIWLKQESKRVWLYNYKEVKNYLHVVNTSNPRLEKNIMSLYGGVR